MLNQILLRSIQSLAMLALCSVSMAYAAQMRYLDSQLTNYGLAAPTIAASESVCVSTCNATYGCSAVSYSSGTQQCVMSLCANLRLSTSTSWVTISLNYLLRDNCDIPAPRLEWMMTDKCGNSSTGIVSGVPDMQSSVSVVNLASPSAYFGNAYTGSDSSGSICWSVIPSASLDFDFTQSYTIFLYAYFKINYGSYPFIEFQYRNATTGSLITYGPHFWYATGLYFNVGVSIDTLTCTNPAGCTGTAPYNRQTNGWIPLAMVYDSVGRNVTVYANGAMLQSFNLYGQILATNIKLTCNFAFAGCRDTSIMYGSIYCLKFFGSALDSTQLTKVGNSCIYGKVSST